MSACEGDGTCYTWCECMCFDSDTFEYHETCSCGHRSHTLKFCRENPCIHNCELIKCTNFDICGYSMPEYESSQQKNRGREQGLCYNCWYYHGKLKKTSEPEDCCICFEEKILVELSCHSTHKLCFDCWDKSIKAKKLPSTCPQCRKQIGFGKYNEPS